MVRPAGISGRKVEQPRNVRDELNATLGERPVPRAVEPRLKQLLQILPHIPRGHALREMAGVERIGGSKATRAREVLSELIIADGAAVARSEILNKSCRSPVSCGADRLQFRRGSNGQLSSNFV
jgi:hypothetical protein